MFKLLGKDCSLYAHYKFNLVLITYNLMASKLSSAWLNSSVLLRTRLPLGSRI